MIFSQYEKNTAMPCALPCFLFSDIYNFRLPIGEIRDIIYQTHFYGVTTMSKTVLYIHGKNGSAEEAEHYRPLFPKCDIVGLDYRTFTPWETGIEIKTEVERLAESSDGVILIANSIGAYFSMCAGIDGLIEKAYFISPIVDMEGLVLGMMALAEVSEDELKEKGVVRTTFNEELSWDYLCYVRKNRTKWSAPTEILYGGLDELTPRDVIEEFSKAHGAALTVMENGEHWFHTEEQMAFLDKWIKG